MSFKVTKYKIENKLNYKKYYKTSYYKNDIK